MKCLESRNFTELGDGQNEEDEWDCAAAVDDEEAITGDGGGKENVAFVMRLRPEKYCIPQTTTAKTRAHPS